MKRRKSFPIARVRRLFATLPMFKPLNDSALDRLVRGGRLTVLGPGEILFEIGQPADRIHVVVDGALEILRPTPGHPAPEPVAYLTPGEVIGSVALLTGTARRSAGRVPEYLVAWTMMRGPFEALAKGVPGYWQQIARMFAARHETMLTDEFGSERPQDLSGRLAFFDLPTVIQTLATSQQTGVLTLGDEAGGTRAEVMIVDGRVVRARSGDTDGEDAFLEIVMSPTEDHFHFHSVGRPTPDAIGTNPIVRPTMELLMEAARRADESADHS